MPPTGVCINCGKPHSRFSKALCKECEIARTLNDLSEQIEKEIKHSRKTLRLQDKIMKICTVIVVVSLAVITYGIIFV
jgi:hypothetical protein